MHDKIEIVCEVCGNHGASYPDHGNIPRFCSPKCRGKARRTVDRSGVCPNCNKEFDYRVDKYSQSRVVKYCSDECRKEYSRKFLEEKHRKKCVECGNGLPSMFSKDGRVIPRRGNVFCSDLCTRLWKRKKGKGRSVQNNGYVMLSKSILSGKELELANAMVKSDSIMEHRLVMAMDIGRPLEKGEVVHHINGNPADNRIQNLMLQEWNVHSLSHKENNRIVLRMKKRIAELEREVMELRQQSM